MNWISAVKIYEERITTLENEVRGLIRLITENITDINTLQEEWEEIFGEGLSKDEDINAMFAGEPVTDPLIGDNITTDQDIVDIYNNIPVTNPLSGDNITNDEDIEEMYAED